MTVWCHFLLFYHELSLLSPAMAPATWEQRLSGRSSCLILLLLVFCECRAWVVVPSALLQRIHKRQMPCFAERSWPGDELTEEAHVAASLVTGAVELCRHVQASLLSSQEKGDASPVTAADLAIQAFVTLRLGERFPQDFIVGEEDASVIKHNKELRNQVRDMVHTIMAWEFHPDSVGNAATHNKTFPSQQDILRALDRGVHQQQRHDKRVWILDPIDGTKGLLTGQGYSVGLALCAANGELLLGALGNPSPHQHYPVMVAVRGRGLRFYNGNSERESSFNSQWLTLQDIMIRDNPSYSGLPLTCHNWQLRQQHYFSRPSASSRNTATMLDDNYYSTSSGTNNTNHNKVPGVDYPPYLLSRPMTQGSPLPFGPECPPCELCCGSLVKYFAVARGEVAGFVQFQDASLKIWDHAPGILCVQESGGLVVDGNGQEIRLFLNEGRREFSVTRGIICCAQAASDETRKRLLACLNI